MNLQSKVAHANQGKGWKIACQSRVLTAIRKYCSRRLGYTGVVFSTVGSAHQLNQNVGVGKRIGVGTSERFQRITSIVQFASEGRRAIARSTATWFASPEC